MEPPGKDSARFRQAGAHEVMGLAVPLCHRVHELRGGPELTLAQQLDGWRRPTWCWWKASSRPPSRASRFYRPALGKPALHAEDAGFLAVVTDAAPDATLPCLPLNEPDAVAAFICRTGAGAGESLGFRRAGQDQSVTGRRRTTLAPCRPGKQDIHDPIDSRTDPGGLPSPRHRLSTRIIATSLAALVVVLSMISWTLWLSWQLEAGAGAAINDTGSLRMRANRVAVELMRPQEGRKVRTDEQILLMDETIARLAGNGAAAVHSQ